MKTMTILIAIWVLAPVSSATSKEPSLIDYFLPRQPQGAMVSVGVWGADNVLPRDISNGLEDSKMENWCYWDGGIVKSENGRYHLYASRWTQSVSHRDGWHLETKGIHAVSDHAMGPCRREFRIIPMHSLRTSKG